VRKVTDVYYLCNLGHKHKTSSEAYHCEKDEEVKKLATEIDTNPNFELQSHYVEATEIEEDSNIRVEPKEANTVAQIEKVIITSVVTRGMEEEVWIRKTAKKK